MLPDVMIFGALALLSFVVWLYLVFAHGRFWLSGPQIAVSVPAAFPAVDIIVPARDEAHTIAAVIGSLLRQNYAGSLRVFLVDDNSSDGTSALAGEAANLTIIRLDSKPEGWSGKLWALSRGVEAGRAPLLLLCDADIVHDPRHLASLVARQQSACLDMVSEMVRLNCTSCAERALIPAFVYFFQMLYPFSKVNDPRSKVAAAAGGTVLISRTALAAIGGIASIKNALIDDVTLAKAVKRHGAIYLGHSGLASSIRPYPGFADIWRMITRTAFTQLRYSPALLLATVAGLILVWFVPAGAAVFGHGWTRAFGAGAAVLALASYCPTLSRYRCSKMWSLALPLIALFYMAATIGSAVNHWRGKGATWKERAYDA